MQHVAPVVEHFGGARSAIGCLSTTNDACALYRVRHISEFSPLESIGVMVCCVNFVGPAVAKLKQDATISAPDRCMCRRVWP